MGLLETGTQVLCGAQLGPYATGEVTLAADVVPCLTPTMLCLADRGLLGFDLWQRAAATGAALLWRAKALRKLRVLARFADGSYRSVLRWNAHCASTDRRAIPVRVVEYTLVGLPRAESRYRLLTTILDPARAPAVELAALYNERWEIETAFDAFNTHLKGARRRLRSKTPELVRQEAWGFLLAHVAIRAMMHEAALGRAPPGPRPRYDVVPACPPRHPPDAPASGGHSALEARPRVHQAILAELREAVVRSGRGRAIPRGVKRQMSNHPFRPRRSQRTILRIGRPRILLT